MSQIDPRVDTPLMDWSELGVSELPTGTVTLLLADVEGSTRLWQSQPEQMTAILEGCAELGGRFAVVGHMALGIAALAAGDGAAAHEVREAARQDMIVVSGATAALQRIWNAEAALADGDLAAAAVGPTRLSQQAALCWCWR